jgi:hypothetical protein
MDIANLLAERCSSFEVAWSDGSTWQFDEPVRIETDGVFDSTDENTVDRILRRGDIIWFDMNFTRQDLWNVISGNFQSVASGGSGFDPTDPRPAVVRNSLFSDIDPEFDSPNDLLLAQQYYPQPEPGVEIGDRRVGSSTEAPSTLPLAYTDSAGDRIDINGFISGQPAAGRENRLFGFRTLIEDTWNDSLNERAEYSAELTGGVLPDQGDEYLAIFGFRDPNDAGNSLDGPALVESGYAQPTLKPRFIRIRVTLHDRQFRIPGGRDYEFVFELDPIEVE